MHIMSIITLYAQNTEYTFGKLTTEDLNFKKEKIDSTANAVVLYESGNTIFVVDDRDIVIKTTFYFKIKIFNSEGFENATFTIPIYNNKSDAEKVVDIKGITHNLNNNTTYLSLNNVFTEQKDENWKTVKFTMPNLKEESIIEVTYTVVTPFIFNLTGWEFQSDIPKLLSKYKASIPGNYLYNRTLNGYLKLTVNDAILKKNCFWVPEIKGDADCEVITYGMENIPAFEEEEYMTDRDNFISKIKFELAQTVWFDGTKKKYTTTWEEVDREFESDKNIGAQLRKTNYFEGLIPTEIVNMPDELDRAKAVYSFIQNHFSWNEKYGIFKNVRVKDAYDKEVGNASEINISLINALNSVGLNTELVLISTRSNGFPTRAYPVISDFNYVLAKVNINNRYYLLDATNKLNPFGLLPFQCLNNYGRVMDFENESYWIDFSADTNSNTNYYADLILNENGTITGKIKKVYTGYNALDKRIAYQGKNEDEIIAEFESAFTNLSVIDYNIENTNDIDKPLIETFDLEIEFENPDLIYFNPFFGGSFKENPFKQEVRSYPVDFGYTKKYTLIFNMELPENYKITSFPNITTVNLEKEKGSFTIKSRKVGDYKFSLSSTFKITEPIFYSHEYKALKEIFKHVITNQKTPIVIQKNTNP